MLSINWSSAGVSSSIKADLLAARRSGAFSCALTQCHNLPRNEHPIKLTPRSNKSLTFCNFSLHFDTMNTSYSSTLTNLLHLCCSWSSCKEEVLFIFPSDLWSLCTLPLTGWQKNAPTSNSRGGCVGCKSFPKASRTPPRTNEEFHSKLRKKI